MEMEIYWGEINKNTLSYKTVEKYLKKEKKKLSDNEKKSKLARIKAKLSTLHNTGFFNTYYSKMLRRYEEADKKAEKGNFKNLDDIIKELSDHKNKISIELKNYIIGFIEKFDMDLFIQIPDKEIKEFFEKKTGRK